LRTDLAIAGRTIILPQMTPDQPGGPIVGMPAEIRFAYEKSSSFSTIYADGAMGGPVPSGNVYVAFFVERAAHPDASFHKIDPGGRVAEQVRTEGHPHLVRELQTAVILNLNSARAVRDLLSGFIAQVEVLNAATSKQNP
jgi:hypothetical protein